MWTFIPVEKSFQGSGQRGRKEAGIAERGEKTAVRTGKRPKESIPIRTYEEEMAILAETPWAKYILLLETKKGEKYIVEDDQIPDYLVEALVI